MDIVKVANAINETSFEIMTFVVFISEIFYIIPSSNGRNATSGCVTGDGMKRIPI